MNISKSDMGAIRLQERITGSEACGRPAAARPACSSRSVVSAVTSSPLWKRTNKRLPLRNREIASCDGSYKLRKTAATDITTADAIANINASRLPISSSRLFCESIIRHLRNSNCFAVKREPSSRCRRQRKGLAPHLARASRPRPRLECVNTRLACGKSR